MTINTLPILNRQYISKAGSNEVNIIQFGTGVLLRGLIDYIFQQVNDAIGFGANIAMIKSTAPDITEFTNQDSIYTVVASGLNSEMKQTVSSTIINCIQQTLSIEQDWGKIESLFCSENLSIIVSNVTEAGLSYLPIDDNKNNYPANLTKLLHTRFLHFKSKPTHKLYIIPTELLVGNGSLLKSLVVRHAQELQYGAIFLEWLDLQTSFCDSLVDRIVAGKWKDTDHFKLPYNDSLAVATEPYFLWAIQGNDALKKILPLESIVPGFYIRDTIESFREQKLRLLNGCHSLLSPMAYAVGHSTVEDMMNDPMIFTFFKSACEQEILPTLKEISPDAVKFYHDMEMRWKNPFIKHELKSILTQSISKWTARNGETFTRFYNKFGYLPPFLTFGYSMFLYVYRPMSIIENKYMSAGMDSRTIEYNDQKINAMYHKWSGYVTGHEKDLIDRIHSILKDNNLFNHNFTSIPGLADKIIHHFQEIEKNGISNAVTNFLKTS